MSSTFQKTDFFLASTEDCDFEAPRRCRLIKQVRIGERDDCAMVQIDPPVAGRRVRSRATEIDILLLQARHQGCTLFPVNEWPLFVHIARPRVRNPEARDTFKVKEIDLMAWGEIYLMEEAARNKDMPG